MVNHGFDDVILKLLQHFVSEFFARKLSLGIDGDSRSDSHAKHDRHIATRLWNYIIHLCGRLAEFTLMFKKPPYQFLALLDDTTQADTLKNLSHGWDVLMKLEEHALKSAEVTTTTWCHRLPVRAMVS